VAVTGGFCPLPARLGGDATTGLTVEQHARLAADHVAKKRTAPFCVFQWSLATDGATPIVSNYRGMNGAGSDYAPTVNSSIGSAMTFRWARQSFSDAYQVATPFTPRHASANVQSSGYIRAVVELLSDGVRIRVFNSAGTAVSAPVSGSCELW